MRVAYRPSSSLRAMFCVLIFCTAASPASQATEPRSSTAPAKAEVLQFSASVPLHTPHLLFRQLFLAELCQRVQKQCALQVYPPPRAEMMLRNGEIDGDLGRGAALLQEVPQALMVPTNMAEINFVSLSLASNTRTHKLQAWQGLQDLHVVYIRGYRFVEQHKNLRKLQAVGSYEACFGMVQDKRADVCILPAEIARQLWRESGQTDQHFQVRYLEKGGQYVYLAKHRAELLPLFEQAIQAMHKDGTVAALTKKSFAK
jgi:hypothetical protein